MDGQPPLGPAEPRWGRRATPRPQPLAWSKPRPQSYQSPSGLLVTDFPVEDRCAVPVTRPAGTGSPAAGSVSNGTGSPSMASVSNGAGSPAAGSVSNGAVPRSAPRRAPALPSPPRGRDPPARSS
ncbi:rho guanine nucleotide exchange factor 26-like [Oenanthe melanoleuca]|uniref:rho guanine nucleotide exchange factor 26-like n=1 Tax=Oenanthe melanoleuca TaxID=2939378 RepID=UPI0024C13C04|nr:rho guanine nucleotide exchange factor 26-like [Oenanthe melanoleuca]